MKEPLPVTDADRVHAWFAFYARPAFPQIPVRPPDDFPDAEVTLAALTRVLEADRERMAERGPA